MGWKDKRDSGGGDFAPSWQPDVGDEVMGVIVAMSERTKEGRNGPITYPIATIAVATGDEGSEEWAGEELAIHGASYVLGDELGDAAVGDFLAATYNGTRKSKAGNEYHSYNVVTLSPDDDDFPKALGDVPARIEHSTDDGDADEEPF